MKLIWELLNSDEEDIFMPDEEGEVSDYEKEEKEEYDGSTQTKRIMNTPFGIAVIDNGMNPFKKMQLFQFHTDFYLSSKIVKLIEKTPGVEVLKILTPYRGILSVGKAFNSTDVRREIDKRVVKKEMVNPALKIQLEKLKEQLKPYKSWSILLLPNGYADYCVLKDDNSNLDEFNKLNSLYEESLPLNGGLVFKKPENEKSSNNVSENG
jgi:hypothetical protein